MPQTLVGRFEYVVLIATLYVGDDAYAVPVADAIARRTGSRPARGALYTTLARLENKGLLASSRGAPTPERGGKAKRYYRVTARGKRAIRETRLDLVSAWPGLARLIGSAG
jgi:DNA-binding PadR family transcriptional regulator